MFFFYVKIYSIYTIHWDKTQMLKKFLSDKINAANNAEFFYASSNSSQFYC